MISHYTPMISMIINALLYSNFRLLKMNEPDISKEQKIKFPHKNEWMEKYFGIINL